MCVAAEEKLAAKGKEAEGLRAQVARLEADLENAMRMQEELLQENEHAAAEFEKMLSQVHRSVLRDRVDADQVDLLVAVVEHRQKEALALVHQQMLADTVAWLHARLPHFGASSHCRMRAAPARIPGSL